MADTPTAIPHLAELVPPDLDALAEDLDRWFAGLADPTGQDPNQWFEQGLRQAEAEGRLRRRVRGAGPQAGRYLQQLRGRGRELAEGLGRHVALGDMNTDKPEVTSSISSNTSTNKSKASTSSISPRRKTSLPPGVSPRRADACFKRDRIWLRWKRKGMSAAEIRDKWNGGYFEKVRGGKPIRRGRQGFDTVRRAIHKAEAEDRKGVEKT
jgi:hypothetical protein